MAKLKGESMMGLVHKKSGFDSSAEHGQMRREIHEIRQRVRPQKNTALTAAIAAATATTASQINAKTNA